jgi:hypothetical protein
MTYSHGSIEHVGLLMSADDSHRLPRNPMHVPVGDARNDTRGRLEIETTCGHGRDADWRRSERVV